MYPHAAEQFKKIVVQISIQRKKKEYKSGREEHNHHGAFSLSECHSLSTSMWSPTRKLSKPHYLIVFMEVSLHGHD
jgi:hypothetical protein